MANCCVCGKVAEEDCGNLLVYGRPAPICASCGNILDDVESVQQNDPKREELHKKIKEKMISGGAMPAVVETIESIFSNTEDAKIQEYVEQEKAAAEREAENNLESSEPSTSEGSISSLSSFLSVFAVIFLILAIILSLVIGIPLTRFEPATGWTVIIGGILGSVLTFSIIMLTLSVASTIANISNKLDETNEQIASTNKQLNRIASIITNEFKKQKK